MKLTSVCRNGEAEKGRFQPKPQTEVQKQNEEIVSQIILETDGTACSLGNKTKPLYRSSLFCLLA